jgi:biopolymer transport protein ExbD
LHLHALLANKSVSSGLTAPLVKIDAKGHLSLNYQQTTWEELPAGLDQALQGLPVRVVYFDGDGNIPFVDAAHAIDIIQGLGAKPILLTPGSKAEN